MPSSITLTVKHLPTSTSFFLSALQPLGYVYRGRVDSTIGFGLPDTPPDFWITQEIPGVAAGAAHVAFPANSQQHVQDFFILALKSGGKCHGEPALRDTRTGYYSAAVIDFDGNSIEAVFRPSLVDEGYGSRPSSISSVSSVKPKSTMSSKAPTMVSKASTATPNHTESRSVAPSKAPTSISRAPSSTSKAPTQASRNPTQVSRTPTAASSHVSRAPTPASRTPTQVSRAPSQAGDVVVLQPGQAITHTTPTGEVVTTIISEAQGAISIARELISHVRPALDSANSAPNIKAISSSDSNSHKPSDTIVGTLLGVAAGAALGYAYHRVSEGDKRKEAEPRPNIARTNTEPSFANGERQMYYYHEYANMPTNQPYAIEAPPSEYSYQPTRGGSQRYITMEDKAERLSDYAPSQRPRRRSSFSGVDVRSFASKPQATTRAPGNSTRMIEGPPTSYRAPTAITSAETHSRVSGRSRSKSRASSNQPSRRAESASSTSKHSRHSSRSRHGDNDGDTHSRASHRSSTERSDATTVKPIRPSAISVASASKPSSRAPSRTSSSRPSAEDQSSRVGAGRTGRSELTKSVVGKLEESDRLNVTNREVDPSDSVSQVSSVRSRRRSVKEKVAKLEGR